MLQAIELENAIRNGIPISAQMDFRVQQLTAQQITVSGGANENINVHNTAFAGSIYSICTLAAWGLTYSKLPKKCSLVMAKASIEYLKPVQGEITAKAPITAQQTANLLEQLASKGKARVTLSVTVINAQQLAVIFHADLHVRMHR
ncbi:MAG: YiiD C-terminal domain-containing protein [Oceanospirillaceae bacterium]|nr:YiiD C-terminal domain-containing protein [Oceanospirillaceae bacterium]